MNNMAARISVIIPNYNRAGLVGETIENMLRQSFPPAEVIVVDDGSTDDSVKVIRSFGDKVKLIEQSNQGPGAARNAGLFASTGDFIQFMDSDDLASSNKFKIQLTAIKENCADFAYCPWVRTKISGRDMEFAGPVMQGRAVPEWKSMLEWQMGPWCLVFQNCLFRRRILLKAGQFRTDLMPSEDSEYLVRILLAGARPVFTGDCLVFYRIHDHGQITASGTSSRKRAEDWTNYLRIVGEKTASQFDTFQASTLREIALNVYRHNRYCRKNGWPALPFNTPFSQLTMTMSKLNLICLDYMERIQCKFRRLPGSTPNSEALALRAPTIEDYKKAQEVGFDVVPSRTK
jgi:glycosyltransferase involved in cell wall biosynthesis